MSSVKVWATVLVAALAGTSAKAADMPYQPPPMPMPVPMQPVCVPRAQAPMYPGVPICAEEELFSSWYLRGDIVMSNQQVGSLDNFLYAGNMIQPVGMGFDSAPIFGIGVGYQYNDWMRFDLTAEYRGKANFHGLDIVNRTFTDEYHASKSEWLFLANAYLDLGTWWCVTPFVGLGLGFSRNTISSFLDINTPFNGVAFAAAESQWSFAWALHAGLAVKATPNMTFEFSYRYVSLGDATTGDIMTYTGTNNFFNPMLFKNISSHDFRLGMRFTCCDLPAAPPPPPQMVYQPQPQLYVPPPVYAPPPPLMRKG
jgi:opacity protein-like surface antigen